MNGHGPRRLVSAALLVAIAPWCAGCATEIHLRQTPGAEAAPGRGRLVVRVFESAADRRREVATRRAVITELYRVQDGEERLVREERAPHWSVADLVPGAYVLRVSRWADDSGTVRMLPSSQDAELDISANETDVADVVLSDPRKALIGLGIAACVVAGAAVVKAEIERSFRWRGTGYW